MSAADVHQRDREATDAAPGSGLTAAGLVFVIGFFAMVAQTLLFRLFLTVFEGNEFGIACFFGSWLTWVAVGAAIARSRLRVTTLLADRFELLPLLYVPAFLLQWWLIEGARELAGVQRYEMFPLLALLPVTFLANAPVSFCTGLLFTRACGWFRRSRGLPVAGVYVWECAGGLTGGVAVTLLLARGVSAETLFAWTAVLVTLAPAVYLWVRRSHLTGALPILAVAAVLLGFPERWEHSNDLRTWHRLLPPRALLGSFTTPEAKYLYGEHSDQFNVVSWETVTDSIPDTEHASEVIALHLAQRPAARRFLVAGPGSFSICRRLLDLPQADVITWFSPDPAYPAQLRRVLPARLAVGLDSLETPAGDIRRWLRESRAAYDLIILNFPDPTTLALNRYFTREFFLLLKAHLAPEGALGVRVSAGENYMSEERANAGASVFHTLRSVFAYMAIKPGEESWFIVSDSPGLTAAPAVLRERFTAVEGADRLYPPAGLMSLYQPGRTEYQRDCYERTGRGTEKDVLINTERSPKALLHGLLYAVREAGGADSLGVFVRTFARHGLFVVPLGILLFVLLRSVFLWRGRRGRLRAHGHGLAPPVFDGYALVFTAGAAGMGGSIVLMYLYQAAFGSIFLHAGLLGALYMLGLAAGGAVSTRVLKGTGPQSARLPVFVLLIHALFYAGIALLGQQAGRAAYAAAFVISGLLGGVYVPVAAGRLREARVPHDSAGAAVAILDHVGGAAGGLAIGLLLLPVFGSLYGLIIVALLLLVNVPVLIAWTRASPVEVERRKDRRPGRAAGYVLFGCGVFAVASGLLLRRGGEDSVSQAFLAFSRAAAGRAELQEPRRVWVGDKALRYFVLPGEAREGQGAAPMYAFMTDALAPAVSGYGGAVVLAALTGADGTLQDVSILPSRETPAYLDYLRPWLARLAGKNIFAPAALGDVDTVTGATLTSAAVLQALREAGPAFARVALGLETGPAVPSATPRKSRAPVLWLAATAVAALALRRRPSRGLRRALLLAVVAGSGILLNAQYSSAHVLSLLGLSLPAVGWSAAFAAVVGIPVMVALFGNVYCGYLCPFGALQELIGDLRPTSLSVDPDKVAWGRARFVKYVVLTALVLLFGLTLLQAPASADPLVTVFAGERSPFVWCLALLLLGLGFFFPRFWCRCLCPAGAFLALLNGVRLLRRLVPAVVPRACAFGVRDRRELDCLCCDRCRRPGRYEKQALARRADWRGVPRVNAWLQAAAVILACLVVARAVSEWRGESSSGNGAGGELKGGASRPVDMKKFLDLIEQGRLSDQEARFYRSTPDGPVRP